MPPPIAIVLALQPPSRQCNSSSEMQWPSSKGTDCKKHVDCYESGNTDGIVRVSPICPTGTTATTLVNASTTILRKRRGTQSTLINYLTRNSDYDLDRSNNSCSATNPQTSNATNYFSLAFPFVLPSLSATSACVGQELSSSFGSLLPPPNCPPNCPTSNSYSTLLPPHHHNCPGHQHSHPQQLSERSTRPLSAEARRAVWQVYENVKRKILESQQQHWEALAEYWHWYLWHRDSDFSGNVFMVDPQSSSVSLSCTSASPMAVIQHEAQALTFNSCSKVQYPLNEPQGPIRYYAGDCYNTDRHGTMIKDMSLFQSHTEKGGASGAMLNKDIRKHQGQGSTEPRPISEPLLAREPTLISDRADGHHRSNEIALSPSTKWSTSFSATLPPPLSISTSATSISLSSSPSLITKTSPLSVSTQSLSTNHCTCHTIHPNMAIAAISHACSQSSISKHFQYPSSPSVLASSLQTVRYASEQGKLLAQRSKTNLNRLLDSVMDNATTLTESSSRHQYQSGDENRPTLAESLPTKTIRQLSITSSSATRQPSTRIHNSKAKFFVCEDDSEEDEEAEQEQDDQYFNAPSFIKVRSSMELIGFCHSDFQVFKQPDQNDYDLDDYEQDQDQDQDTDEEDYFEKRVSAPIPSGGAPEMGRRHSLLSDLFMAEKLLVAQSASSSKAGNSNTTTTRAQPRLYPSPPLHRYNNASSEGDDPFRVAVNPQQLNQSTHLEALSTCQTLVGLAHQSIQSNHHQYQNFGDRIFTQAELTLPKAKTCQERTPESPLKRTKKSMFKNLDELAVDLITEYQENNILDSSIPQSPHPESTSTNSAIASETYTCKTNLVTLSPALTPTSSTSTSPLNASSKKPPPHSTLPSPAKTCRCSPATATTKTAFATVSATSKCIAPASSVFSAVSVAAAVAATAGVGEDNYGWNQVYNLQTHLQSICENLSSSIQRAISTPSST